MQLQFEIRPSTSQLVLLLAGHALIAVAIGFHVEPLLLKLGGIVLLCLLALRESRQLIDQGSAALNFDLSEPSIELRLQGQPYFYRKYKVYANRWFAILKLIDKPNCRTLILNPDRFTSIQSYRQLRRTLRRLEGDNAT